MRTAELKVQRWPGKFTCDARRVITRLFIPGDEARIKAVIERVLQLDQKQAAARLDQVLRLFAARHRNLEAVFRDHYAEVAALVPARARLSEQRRLLIGAYFTKEYSFESAALFNPSIVPHPDQTKLPPGAVRFLMSLRATGEGHVSSVVFRTGVIDASGELTFSPPSPFARSLEPLKDHRHDKQRFFLKLIEMGAYTNEAGDILERLEDEFTYNDLERVVSQMAESASAADQFNEAVRNLRWLARSNYLLELPPHSDPSEIVIFPASENESRGMEDMRLVRFVDENGEACYYGIYTAYNGFGILPQLMETREFRYIRVTALHGKYVQNKGQALFPRLVDGWYLMLSRQDGENLYLLRSKNIRFWNETELLRVPTYPWEFVQVGNCGSPLELPQGWLVLTHGVGPMRQYCIGAMLLDLADPTRVIGQTAEPILAPVEEERDGYVPNVVYSCGAMIHQDRLIMPYAMSDSATSVATISVRELLEHLSPPPTGR